jgi:hypothetical protein
MASPEGSDPESESRAEEPTPVDPGLSDGPKGPPVGPDQARKNAEDEPPA